MWKYLRALINLYLYSSLHIALCAGLLGIETYLVLRQEVDLNLILCLALGTLAVYALHRIVGINKTVALSDQGRFKLIAKYKSHLFIYFVLSSIVFVYFFLVLDKSKMVLFSAACLPTLLYILPVFPKGKRLRDYPFIKIFIIAIVWSYLTIVVPAAGQIDFLLSFLLIERILFFLAITIPFDIRDMKVDNNTGVPTLIHQLGVRKSKSLAILFLLVSTMILLYLLKVGLIDFEYLIALILTYGFAGILIITSNSNRHDWFYTGLIDGTIGIRIIAYSLLLLI